MNVWPALSLAEWRDTYETLHRWLQIAGKVRLAPVSYTHLTLPTKA